MKMPSWFLRFLRPIKTKKDYENALKSAEKYFYAKRGTPEANIAEILTILIEKYEEENFPIKSPDPIDAIKFRMEQLGLTNGDLVSVIGSKGRVSEILNRKRELSLEMIRRVHTKLRIPAEILIGR